MFDARFSSLFLMSFSLMDMVNWRPCREAHRYLYKTDLLTKLSKCTEIENFEKRGRSLLVVVATPPSDNYEKFTQKVNEYNSKEPFNFTMPSLFTQQKNYTKVNLKWYYMVVQRIHKLITQFMCYFFSVCDNLCGISLWFSEIVCACIG